MFWPGHARTPNRALRGRAKSGAPLSFVVRRQTTFVACPSIHQLLTKPAMPVEVINPQSLRQTRTYFQASIGTGTRLICLAGQAGIDAAGQVVSKGDLSAQTEQAYKNIHMPCSVPGPASLTS